MVKFNLHSPSKNYIIKLLLLIVKICFNLDPRDSVDVLDNDIAKYFLKKSNKILKISLVIKHELNVNYLKV
jgi:hypothetical protein